jgi:hypothetical protein
MATFAPSSRWSIDIDHDVIDVTCGIPTPNEGWTYTDRQGHEHRYEHGYPTLELVVDASHWCMGNEGLYAHDPHEAVDESHYECRICRETIQPKVDPPGTPEFVRGLSTAILNGNRSDGSRLVRYVSEADARAILEADDADAAALALLDADPGDMLIRHERTF